MAYSVVILSKDASNLVPCVRAIWRMEWPDSTLQRRIIVVDDGAKEDAERTWHERCEDSRESVQFISGVKPFIFARNANLGIRAAGNNDVVLLNDDALLETPGGLTSLWRQAQIHPEYGVIAASSNNVGNLNQQPTGATEIRDEPRMVCFVCVLIPRRTIDTVGLLDEEFTGYGFDDDSYCLRVRRAGLKLGIWDGCFVDHGSLRSTYRTEDPNANRERFLYNAAVFRRKYGQDNWGNPVPGGTQATAASKCRHMQGK